MAGQKGRSGGRRVGSGRKPRGRVERSVLGTSAPGPGRVLPGPGAGSVGVVAAIEECDAPDDLTMAERHVWLELAPHAVKARTLTTGTALAFRLLCRNVVLEQSLGADQKTQGGGNHRGILQRVDAELARFCLAPFGKPIYEAEPEQATPVNPLVKFLKRG